MAEPVISDLEVLDYLIGYIDHHGFPPSTVEIAEALVVSSSTVHLRLHGLHNQGLIRIVPGQARAIDVRPALAAGHGPTPAAVAHG